LEPSLVPKPTAPRQFADDTSIDPHLTGSSRSSEPPLSVHVFDATCDLSDLLYRIMIHNGQSKAVLNTDFDVDLRMAFYQELYEWSNDISTILRADVNFTPETCFLR
jgi:hypothetical protein